jgi:ATP-dependent DNA helicase RecQ
VLNSGQIFDLKMETPESVLKKYWQFDSFRPLQREIIESILKGSDTLALLPTGGGKSLCYQVPALLKEGVCVVISPLIALMRDQVAQLLKKDIAAAAIYSGMNYRDIDRIFDNAVYGGLKFLYLSPERLITPLAQERLRKVNVSFLAIDEAHCVSQWGYDFRPAYMNIAAVRELIGSNTALIALTATATPDVVTDMTEKLEFRKNFKIFEQDFARPNIAYIVRKVDDKATKLTDILSKIAGSVVVYTRNRKQTREISQFLNEKHIDSDFYHAGLAAEERNEKQDKWMQNRCRVMVATNAFGMGIDKPNVRAVVHFDVPETPEAYFQEAGRAGRDGEKAYAVLLVSPNEGNEMRKQWAQNFPEMKEIRRVYEALGSFFQLAVGSGEAETFPFDFIAFCNRFNFDILPTLATLRILSQDGWLDISEGIFTPSQLQVLVSRDKLYDYQLKHKDYDRILKGLFRVFEGVSVRKVNFDEGKLARAIQMPVSEVERVLNLLKTDSILDYEPRTDKPQLTFLRQRAESQQLTIDFSLYTFRKKRAEFRLEKILEYTELAICRAQQLQFYFGQHDAKPCLQCDICLEKKKVDLTADELEGFKQKIFQLLTRTPLSMKDLVDSFAQKHQAKVLQTLSFLIDEQILKKENDKYQL